MSSTPQRHYWRNLARATGTLLLVAVCALGTGLLLLVIQAAERPLHPSRATLDETPLDYGMADYNTVEFATSDGVTLRGWMIPSQNGAAIIVAHGYAGNRMAFLTEAALLTQQGYGVLLFDFRGHGESGDATVTLGDHEQRDLSAAVDFMTAQSGADPTRLGVFAHSMGAATATLVAAQDERLRALVLVAPFPTLDAVIADGFHVPRLLREAIAAWIAWRADVTIDAVRPVDVLCDLSPRPVLLIYGELDQVAPPGSYETMSAAACPGTETWLIAGAGHDNIAEVEPTAYPARLITFFDQALHD